MRVLGTCVTFVGGVFDTATGKLCPHAITFHTPHSSHGPATVSFANNILALLALALLVSGTSAFAEASLSVVFDEDNLPYSKRDGMPEGIDVEIARLLALQMGVSLDIHWINTLDEGLLTPLSKGDASIQMAVGVPIEPKTIEDERRVADEVLYSVPYATAQYVVVSRVSTADLPTVKAIGHEPIAVEYASVASSRLWDEGFAVEGVPSQEELLKAVARGAYAYAALWNNAGWLIERDDALRGKLKIQPAPLEIKGMRWNLAVAVGKQNASLLPKINEAIAALRGLDAFRPFFVKYGMPYVAPFNPEEPSTP